MQYAEVKTKTNYPLNSDLKTKSFPLVTTKNYIKSISDGKNIIKHFQLYQIFFTSIIEVEANMLGVSGLWTARHLNNRNSFAVSKKNLPHPE